MIHLIVGNTGAGKTTYSNELRKKKRGGVVFSIDKWNKTLFLEDKRPTDGLEWFLERIECAEKIILDLIFQLQNANVDSILDLGLSKFEHREKFRKFADSNGYELKIHFLDIPKEIRFKRVLKRNKDRGDTYEFEVSDTDFNFMEAWFEPPTEAEMENGVVVKA